MANRALAPASDRRQPERTRIEQPPACHAFLREVQGGSDPSADRVHHCFDQSGTPRLQADGATSPVIRSIAKRAASSGRCRASLNTCRKNLKQGGKNDRAEGDDPFNPNNERILRLLGLSNHSAT